MASTAPDSLSNNAVREFGAVIKNLFIHIGTQSGGRKIGTAGGLIGYVRVHIFNIMMDIMR